MSALLVLAILLLALELDEMVTPGARWGDVVGVVLAAVLLLLVVLR